MAYVCGASGGDEVAMDLLIALQAVDLLMWRFLLFEGNTMVQLLGWMIVSG